MYVRKFYDAGAENGAANGKYELTGEEISLTTVFDSIAEKSNPENQVEEKTEPVVEEKKVEDTKVETVIEKKEEPVVNTPIAATPDWKEVLSKVDKKELHNHLGIDEQLLNLTKEIAADDFAKKLLVYRKENGNLTPFIDAATKDWDKISHEQLILDDLKKQYSNIAPAKAEKLAKSDLNQRFSYKDDPLLSDEENREMAELMSLKLEAEAERIRITRKTEQQQFLDSVKPVDRTVETERLAREKQDADLKEFNAFRAMVENNPSFTKLSTDKQIVLGSKEKAFKYSVNPESIKEQTLDSQKFYGQFWQTEEGKNPQFNFDLWSKVSAYAQNPTAFEEALINHGMSVGEKKIVEGELVNAEPKKDQQSQIKKKSLAKTFAEEGQPVTLGEMMGLQ